MASGLFLTALARRINVPGIILLLLGGFVLGPEVANVIRPESLGDFLPVVVSLAVGIILFEGGLTLDLGHYRQGSKVIRRLLTLGVIVTWLGAAASVWLVFRTDIGTALLCGSLVIVTGPTVIGPLLKRLQLNPRLHGILHWEGVLIDSIGVFVALLCFEWIIGRGGGLAVTNFAIRTLTGLAIGLAGGWFIVWTLRAKTVPDDMRNGFALACAIGIFGMTEAVIFEAGLLSMTVAGLVVGWKQPIGVKQVREFKGELADLLIGLLFLLLAARLKVQQFYEFGVPGLIAVGLIMFVIRPANVFLSSRGSDLGTRDKLFLAWVAPRGIVAASMSSLFAIALEDNDSIDRPWLLETFTYSVIVGTVIFQGMSAGILARLMGLRRPNPTGWVIIGAHALGRRIARFIQEQTKLTVLLVDSNARQIQQAQEENLPAMCGDGLDTSIAEDRSEFQRAGFLLALTDNSELNELLCHRWGEFFGKSHVFRWSAIKGDRPESDLTHGTTVFAELPRPSVTSTELAEFEASLEVETWESKSAPPAGHVLLVARGDQLLPIGGRKSDEFKPGDRLLVLKRNIGTLSGCFETGDVMDVVGVELGEVFIRVERALRQRFEALEHERLWDTSMGAERHLIPLPGRGAALAHAHSVHLKQHLGILVRFPEGLQVGSQSERIRLLFFLVSPASDPAGHLAALAEFGRFCSQWSNLEALRQAEKPSEALSFLRKIRNPA